jgi:hypothetical protein
MQRDHACRSSRLWANFLADSFFRLPYCMIETIDLQSQRSISFVFAQSFC